MDDVCNSYRRFRSYLLYVWCGEVVKLSEIVKPSDFNFRLAEYD